MIHFSTWSSVRESAHTVRPRCCGSATSAAVKENSMLGSGEAEVIIARLMAWRMATDLVFWKLELNRDSIMYNFQELNR